MTGLRPKIQQKLDGLAARVQELLAQSADPKVLERPERLAALNKELGLATPIVEQYRAYQKLAQEIVDCEAIAAGADRDMAELASAELPDLRARRRGRDDDHRRSQEREESCAEHEAGR